MKPIELLRLVWINLSQNKFKVIMTSIGIVVGSATIMLVIAIGTGGKMEVAEQFKNLNAGAIDISYEMANSGFGGFGAGGIGFGGGMSFGGSRSGNPFGGGSSGGGRSSGQNRMPSPPSGMNFSMEGMPDMSAIFGGRNDESERMNREKIVLSEKEMEELSVFVPGVSDVTISYSSNATVEGGELDDSANYTIAGVLNNYMEISNLSMQMGDFVSGDDEDGKEKVCVLGYSVARVLDLCA